MRRVYEVGERQVLEVVVTDEGVVMDAYDGDDHVGTVGLTADEWFAEITKN